MYAPRHAGAGLANIDCTRPISSYLCYNTEVRIRDGQSFVEHRDYIVQNPVKAGLVNRAEQYPYC
jgi:hypothetical protein